MVAVFKQNGVMSLKAYRGDAKTLLAFNLASDEAHTDLAGFTIAVKPPSGAAYFLHNNLRFETPGDHAQDPTESAFSTLNAPIHKFRWLHVPGSVHQGLQPEMGTYTYTATPRYFDARHRLKPIDPSLGVSLQIEMETFAKGKLALGFTRGFTQSQAFVRHFGHDALIRPRGAELLFDTSAISGSNAKGERFTFAQEYEWLGFTARQRIFDLLQKVLADAKLRVDIFAYDLNEPDIIDLMLQLGEAGRIRIILDNAALHHSTDKPKSEDKFVEMFAEKAGTEQIKRGKFGRYAHDKVFIVSDATGPLKVLTGSTNFSVTGLYVNSNHVLVFDDRDVASTYAGVFEQAWGDNVRTAGFLASDWSSKRFSFTGAGVPHTSITFSPHDEAFAGEILGGLVNRINAEAAAEGTTGNVLFAVMELGNASDNPVYQALNAVHGEQTIFSYGISDNPDGIALYPLGRKSGVLVTGKPTNTVLPPPFNQVPNIGGVGHQVHHKFVVCGLNGPDPVVYCGSSNLALKGEQVNGDNLLEIHDADIATVFAIEALGLVDHFNFLDNVATGPKASHDKQPAAATQQAAVSAGWFLSTTDRWAQKYFDPRDLHSVDRELFGE
jgi:PLD-like domain